MLAIIIASVKRISKVTGFDDLRKLFSTVILRTYPWPSESSELVFGLQFMLLSALNPTEL